MAVKALVAFLLGAFAAQIAVAQADLAAAFGAREQLENVSLSPDGRTLAYLVPRKGQGSALLTFAPGIDTEPRIAFGVDGDPDRLSECKWVANDRLICTLWGLAQPPQAVLVGIVNYVRTVSINADGSNPRILSTSGGGAIDLLPEEDGKILIVRDGSIQKVDTRRNSGVFVEGMGSNTVLVLSDGHGAVRVMSVEQTRANKNTGIRHNYYRRVDSDKWQLLGEYNYMTDTGFEPEAVDHERNAVYGFRKKDGRRAVYRIALDGSMREELVFAHDDVDVDSLLYIGRRHRVVGASYVTDVRQTVYFDADLAKLRDGLAKALPKQPRVQIVDSSLDEKKLLIVASSDSDPGVYYVLDRTTREMAIFQPIRPQLEGFALAKMQAISYPANDGTMIPAYLTLPQGSAGKNLPTIVMPHGGPSARDEWGFDWLVQYYAARGFAVLQPNYRGSAGYGDAWYAQNGFKSWQTAVGDILAGGHWLVREGIADPAKLAIVGWSYGGYAALQSVIVDQSLFKAVVGIAPVTDLGRLKGQYKWWSNRKIMSEYIGTGLHIDQGSPARNASRIKVPVLLVHGTMDDNVDVDHSRLMDRRLKEAGVPHKLIIFDKRDHQLEDSEVRARLLRESDAFLRKSMGM